MQQPEPITTEETVTDGLKTIIYPTKHLAQAKALFTALLGVAPSMDAPYYVGFDAAGQHIGLDPNGHARGMAGPTAFWHVDDVASALDALVAAGAEIHQPVTEVGGGKRIAVAKDAAGNPIGLLQPA
jgi:predicted enzyme related to lactoylglutathione lyase